MNGNVVSRAGSSEATLRLPIPVIRPYRLVLRADPLPSSAGQPRELEVLLNGHSIGAFTLTYNPERIGDYTLVAPEPAQRVGFNTLTLRSDGVRFWYLAIFP